MHVWACVYTEWGIFTKPRVFYDVMIGVDPSPALHTHFSCFDRLSLATRLAQVFAALSRGKMEYERTCGTCSRSDLEEVES